MLNKQALMVSSFLNTWIPRSNYIYRINTLLIVGGCKTEVMELFHRLGLSCHPNTIRNQLQACANHFDKQIVKWKYEIEENRKGIQLLEEVLQQQTGSLTKDGMNLCSIDFTLDTISKYKYFQSSTYDACSALLPKGEYHQDTDILKTLMGLKGADLPRYR